MKDSETQLKEKLVEITESSSEIAEFIKDSQRGNRGVKIFRDSETLALAANKGILCTTTLAH